MFNAAISKARWVFTATPPVRLTSARRANASLSDGRRTSGHADHVPHDERRASERGMMGAALASTAYLHALDYAKQRIQSQNIIAMAMKDRMHRQYRLFSIRTYAECCSR